MDEQEWVTENLEELETKQSVALLKAEKRSGAMNIGDLKVDIYKFIQARYGALDASAVRLSEINRRFGVTARQLDKTVTARDLVVELCEEELVSARRVDGSVLVWDRGAHAVAMSRYSDPATVLEFESVIMERAWPKRRSKD